MTEKLTKFGQDTLLLIVGLIICSIPAVKYDLLFTLSTLMNEHKNLHLGEILFSTLIALLFLSLYTLRRFKELGHCRCRLLDSLKQINTLSTTDRLTGLSNQRNFLKMASRDVEIAQLSARSPFVLLIDIDHFKSVNDAYGQSAGDQVLTQLAAIIKESSNRSDLVARYRGQTFIVLIPDAERRVVKQKAERLRREIFNTAFFADQHLISTSVSIGVSSAEPEEYNINTMIDSAELALYESKDCGRNRVVVR